MEAVVIVLIWFIPNIPTPVIECQVGYDTRPRVWVEVEGAWVERSTQEYRAAVRYCGQRLHLPVR